MRCAFSSITDFFEVLNSGNANYLVLRNYENLLKPEMYVDGHGDVDLLCEDAQSIVRLSGAKSWWVDKKSMSDDGIHYFILVKGQRVSLDLRQLGDGYYCKEWEQDLLDRKERYECFFVMNKKDYFYSLIYHAILQKRSLSAEYLNRLTVMSKELEIQVGEYSQQGFISLLEDYMKGNGYRCTYSSDHMVPNRFHLVDKSLIKRDRKLWWKHFKFDLNVAIIEWLVKIKHSIK